MNLFEMFTEKTNLLSKISKVENRDYNKNKEVNKKYYI